MTPKLWAQVKSVLEGALEIEPAERCAFLESVCGGDENLRREVESLLAMDNADAFENPAIAFGEYTESGDAAAFIGRVIGNYRLISELGSGGMGAVFLAERADGSYEQKAALKLIRRGIYSETVLQRFLNERRILASLKHPNIARLLDAGTSGDGVPYFVMEYVEGRPITEYADEQNLDKRERLTLFRKVCSAVSYAHQNLVIHRDLKPSNIFVGAGGEPKLLDFGIAKLLNTGGGNASVTQQFALTPDYSSPEQLRGEKLSTATDVYSLGIILYELLTGKRPYETDGRTYGEIVRIVCETIPDKPSVAAEFNQRFSGRSVIPNPRALRGDLDNIILKSLRKEPEKRYGSVEQFGADIRRYLDEMPVRASRDTWSYRTQKFLSRNRYRVTAGALTAVALAGGLAATLYQANAASRERVRAEQRFNDLRKLASTFTFEINDEIGRSPIHARELLITRSIEYLDRLVQEGGDDDPNLLSELANAYEKIGDLQAKLFNPGLGKTSDALASHQKSLQIRERLFAADPGSAERGLEVMKSRMCVGDIYVTNGGVMAAREDYEAAVSIADDLLRTRPDNDEIMHMLARIHARIGQAVLRSGSLGEADKNYEKALDIYHRLSEKYPPDVKFRRGYGIVSSYIGYVRLEQLQPEDAVAYYQTAQKITDELQAADPQNIQYHGEAATSDVWVGIALGELKRYDEALAEIDQGTSIQKAIFEGDPANYGEQNALGDCYLERARVLLAAGRFDAAADGFREAMKNFETVWKADPQDLAARRQLAYSRCSLADTLARRGEVKKALPMFFDVLKEHEALAQADPENSEWQHDLAVCNQHIGELLLKIGERGSAAEHLRTAVSILESLASRSPGNLRLQRDLKSASDSSDGI